MVRIVYNEEPRRFLRRLLDGNFFVVKDPDEHGEIAKEFTYVILGGRGPTGKSWLWRFLTMNGFRACKISEDVGGLIKYEDNKNHYIVDELNKVVTIVLNCPLAHFRTPIDID